MLLERLFGEKNLSHRFYLSDTSEFNKIECKTKLYLELGNPIKERVYIFFQSLKWVSWGIQKT